MSLIPSLLPPALTPQCHAYYLLAIVHLLHIFVRMQQGRNSIKLFSMHEESSGHLFSLGTDHIQLGKMDTWQASDLFPPKVYPLQLTVSP